MTRLVAVSHKLGGAQPVEKYVKQTYDVMSDNRIDLELIALQISNLPVREQVRFFRLLINYLDIIARASEYNHTPVTMKEIAELSERLMKVVYDYYEEQELNQLTLEGY